MSPTIDGKPEKLLRRMLPPMLATLVEEIPARESEWVFEWKYDGFRALASIVDGEIALWSRNALDLSKRFPEVAQSLGRIRIPELVLDGEVVALDSEGTPRFQLLQNAVAGSTIYFVFDILWLNGTDLRPLQIEQRRELLETLLGKAAKALGPKTNIRLADRIEGSAGKALTKAKQSGWEGLIAKQRGTIYEARRSRAWLKIKAQNEQELAIVGYTPASNSSHEIGALILGVMDSGEMTFAGKVGTGFSSKMRQELLTDLAKDADPRRQPAGAPRMRDATWVKPRLVAQVRFTEWTADHRLRHPAFLGLRPDKRPEECVREKPQSIAVAPKRGKSAAKAAEKVVEKPATKARSKPASKAGVGAVVKKPAKAAKPAARSSKIAAEKDRDDDGLPPKVAAPKKSTKKPKESSSRAVAASPEIKLTSPDRLLYPRDGITKQHVVDYFEAMAEVMIPTLRDRPLALEHWNQGIDKPSWYHQDVVREKQPWMTTIDTPTRTAGKTISHFVADTPAALRWLAQRSVLTLHMWSARGVSLEKPDWIIVDLDPAKGKGIEQAIDTALVLRKLFDSLELPTYPKTSGKRGIHIFIPLAPRYSHEEAQEFACRIADVVSAQLPYATTERSLSARRGRLYLDCLQNAYGKTIVAPYSLRAIDGAPVSAPLKWSEVTKKLDPLKFNIRNMPDRVAKFGDLFAPVLTEGVKLPKLG